MIERILLYPTELSRLQTLKKAVYTPVAPLSVEGAVTSEPVKKENWDDLTYVPFAKRQIWTKEKFACAVFRMTGKVPESAKGKEIVAVLRLGAEGEIYENGEPVQGVTPILATMEVGQPRIAKQIYPLFSEAKGGEDVSFTVDCGNNGIVGVFLYAPRVFRAELAVLDRTLRDYYYDYLTLLLTLTTAKKNALLDKIGEKAIKKALSESYAAYKKRGAAAARERLRPLIETKQTDGVEYTAIGHGHLDLAWKWPLREGRRKAIRTFSNVLAFAEEYDFVFGASQAQMYRWVEEDEPALFSRIQKAVAEGKIEVQGGMWTECDCNIPSGESLIRQFLYGDRYFLEKFGVTSNVVWLPDTFGFPHSLPQIIRGVGKKYFATVKLNWNAHNKFPYQSFNWTGLDGSEVLAHISPEGTYRASASPVIFVKADDNNTQKDAGHALIIYGASDGGGGPGEGHLEMLKRAGNAYLPKTVAASAESFFDKLASKRGSLPSFNGELYLEKHQGTLTAQAKNKYYNRLAERKLHALEWLESVTDVPYEGKEAVWKTVLLNQAHDILTGAAIERVHRESVAALGAACGELDEAIRAQIKLLSKGKGLTALNPSPFPQSGRIRVGETLYAYDCPPYASCPLQKAAPHNYLAGRDHIENDLLKVRFDPETGWITSCLDKETGKELAAHDLLHVLALYEDPKTFFDAWDIDETYLQKKPTYPKLIGMDLYATDERAGCNLHFTVGKSVISQQIYVREAKTIYFDTQISWKEDHKMLRANVRPHLKSDVANFDGAFGSVDRSTSNEGVERAKFEVCGHFYAAIGDETQGYAAVLNNCKYGYRVKGGTVSLNLLRAPTFPDANCDKGEQSFSYAVAFAKEMRDVVRAGYEFNRPVILAEEDVSIEPAPDFGDLIVETVKRAEDGGGTIYRAYERYGKETPLPEACLSMTETDLEERPLGNPAPIVRPHEIKTYLSKK